MFKDLFGKNKKQTSNEATVTELQRNLEAMRSLAETSMLATAKMNELDELNRQMMERMKVQIG